MPAELKLSPSPTVTAGGRVDGHPGAPLTAVSRWEGADYDREVFLIASGADRVCASLYSAPNPTHGVVILPGWARDGRYLLEWSHRLALGVAKRGGCGVLIQWPGNEDSEGDVDAVTLDRLVEVATDAVAAGRLRHPGARWSFAGLRLGGAVAALAAGRARACSIAMVQPDLDPVAYFDHASRSERLNLLRGDPHPGWAFGTPMPAGLRQPDAAALVQQALGSLTCPAAVIRHAAPKLAPLPDSVAEIVVPGNWYFPPGGDHRPLRRQALKYLTQQAR
ncbi:MAG: hypothetical protein WCB85_12700 [Candidatus Dormiibacterota bacterium]